MFRVIKNISFVLIVICASFMLSFSREKQKFDKHITAGLSSVASLPFFANVLPSVGYQMYNNNSNVGYTANSEFLIRLRIERYKVLLIHAGMYKVINPNRKTPVNIGINIGAGINNSYHTEFLASAFISIPVIRKLNLKCEPTIAMPGFKSSFVNFSLLYCFSN